jgi:hypothetical protein
MSRPSATLLREVASVAAQTETEEAEVFVRSNNVVIVATSWWGWSVG